MNRFPVLIKACVTALVLGGCTGSFEDPNPILLVTSYRDDAGAKVALIVDCFGAPQGSETLQSQSLSNTRLSFAPTTTHNHSFCRARSRGDNEPPRIPRLDFLEASVRELPAPAVSYDVIDREGTRRTLVVLSRATPVAGAATGYLNFFALSGIDPNDPAAFTERRELSLEPTSVEFVNPVLDPRFCPSSVQVTQTGAFAAVLNEPQLCGLNQSPYLDILDLQGEQVRVLQRITNVAGSGIYMGQGAAQDLLYYAESAPNSLVLQRAVMPRPGSSFRVNDSVTVQDVTAVTANTARQGNFVDLGRAGAPGNERLVVLFERALVNVTNFTGDGVASEPIATERNNAQVIRNDRRDTDATFFLSTPEAQRFSFLPPAGGTPQLQNATVSAIDAVIEPTYGFIYFVAVDEISLFDLRSFRAGTTLRDPTPFRLRELGIPPLRSPGFITWTQSVPATP